MLHFDFSISILIFDCNFESVAFFHFGVFPSVFRDAGDEVNGGFFVL